MINNKKEEVNNKNNINVNGNKLTKDNNIKVNSETIQEIYIEEAKNVFINGKGSSPQNNNPNSNNHIGRKRKISEKTLRKIIVAIITTIGSIIISIIGFFHQKIDEDKVVLNDKTIADSQFESTTLPTNKSSINSDSEEVAAILNPTLKIPVPNVIGETEDDARLSLSKRGLFYTITENKTISNKIDNSFSYSIVSKQYPKPNTYVENNSIIELYMEEYIYYIKTEDKITQNNSDILKELSTESGELVIHNANSCTGHIYNNYYSENYIGKIEGDSEIIGWMIDINTEYDTMSLVVSLDLSDEDNTHILSSSCIYENRGCLYRDTNSYIVNDEIIIQVNSNNLPFNLNDVKEIEVKNLWKEI